MIIVTILALANGAVCSGQSCWLRTTHEWVGFGRAAVRQAGTDICVGDRGVLRAAIDPPAKRDFAAATQRRPEVPSKPGAAASPTVAEKRLSNG
ncbi:MAG: hypothetical protein N3B01_06725, partial [Verrucomicrobiae bacterium]|nr:hypothetical protein [Verrucomicrobiae bacterium]